jgi:hypothetical protein
LLSFVLPCFLTYFVCRLLFLGNVYLGKSFEALLKSHLLEWKFVTVLIFTNGTHQIRIYFKFFLWPEHKNFMNSSLWLLKLGEVSFACYNFHFPIYLSTQWQSQEM